MKKKMLLLVLLPLLGCSQYLIKYDYVMESFDSYGSSKTIDKCYLYTDNIQSKFIKDRIINGKKEQELHYPDTEMHQKFKEDELKEITGDSIGYVVTKFFAKDSLYTRNEISNLIKEKNEIEAFTVFEEYKTILTFKCQKAITKLYGREFTVWFTTEIPVNDGPWKLYGLPGLILEAHSADNFHNFYATSIKNITNTSFIYASTPYNKILNKDQVYQEIYEFSEKNFKYRKSKSPDAKLKVTINSLDMPLIVFE